MTFFHSVGLELVSGDTTCTDLKTFVFEELSHSPEDCELWTIGKTDYLRRDYIKEANNGLPPLYTSVFYALAQGKYISLSVSGETPQQRDEWIALLQPL